MKPDNILGSYSYKTGIPNRFNYTDSTGTKYYYQITHVNINVAAIQFFDKAFTQQRPIPPGINLTDSQGTVVPPFGIPGSFFITWVESYFLNHNDATIWKLINQKQHTVIKESEVDIVNV